jgi:hypothetical protein
MHAVKLICSLAAVSLGIVAAAAPPVTAPRDAHQVAALAPQALAWIRQEAQRESATNTISESAAAQAVARCGLDFGSMPIEDVVAFIMQAAQQDAESDLRQMLVSAQLVHAQKQAQRRSGGEKHAAPASGQNGPALATQQMPTAVARSPALDSYLGSLHLGYDALSDMTQEQQLRLQMALDRRNKAAETLANIQKKISDTNQGIIQNIK